MRWHVEDTEVSARVDPFVAVLPGMLQGAADDDVAERLLGDVMAHLLACDDVDDPSIGYDRVSREVEIEVCVEAIDTLDAIGKASSLIRAAVHAAGIGTPGWPSAPGAVVLVVVQGPRLEPVGG